MPELPEVETTRRGIMRYITGTAITDIIVHNSHLRWPVPVSELATMLPGLEITAISRRAKYLLFHTARGTLIVHLGMSGSLRVLPCETPLVKHEHLEINFTNNKSLRMRDPRRFGAVLWTTAVPEQHPLLAKLGPEPLTSAFDGKYLYRQSRQRRRAIKNLIMDALIVVGVGNIYACESLFHAGIRPGKAACRLSQRECHTLVDAIKTVLASAIKAGGTSLRDFTDSEGNPGYFRQSLYVYGRNGKPCRKCRSPVKNKRIGQRSSFYCPDCQQ